MMKTNDFENGRASALREIRADGWTPAFARKYLAECAEYGTADGRDDFDRGFMHEITALAARGEA